MCSQFMQASLTCVQCIGRPHPRMCPSCGTFKFKLLPLSAPLPTLIQSSCHHPYHQEVMSCHIQLWSPSGSIIHQSSCSFNRISTCSPSNPHGICEVGCNRTHDNPYKGMILVWAPKGPLKGLHLIPSRHGEAQNWMMPEVSSGHLPTQHD